jgi:nucleoid-associated protein EbfC
VLYTPRMVSFSELRNSYKFQKQAKQVQKELKNIHVEAEASGVKVTVSAGMEVISIEIAPEVLREKIPTLLVDALNRAMKKAQVVSAERMQGVMGQMGLGAA